MTIEARSFQAMRSTTRIALLAVFAFVLFVGPSFADGGSAWEGAGAIGSETEFPPAGLYAASDTFPRNSIINVLNLDNGQGARLIVVRRLNVPGLFMLVSPEAGKSLGMSLNNTSRLRVTPVTMPGLADTSPNADLPYSPDPDINPAAAVADPNAAIKADRSALVAQLPQKPAPQTTEKTASTQPPRPAETASPAAAPSAAAGPAAASPAAAKPTPVSPTPAEQAPAVITAVPPERPTQDQLVPGARAAGEATGATAPGMGGGVLPRLPAGPEAALAEPTSPTIAAAPTPPAPAPGPGPEAVSPPEAAAPQGAAKAPTAEPSTQEPSVSFPAIQPSEEGAVGPKVPALPSVPRGAVAELPPATPGAGTLPGVTASPRPPSVAAQPKETPQSIYSSPAPSNLADEEISSLETRAPQQSLFVAPRPEGVASVLPAPPAPSQELNVSPDQLALANPGPAAAPPVAGLPSVAAPAQGSVPFSAQVPGAPGKPSIAKTPAEAPPTAASAGPEVSDLGPRVPPQQPFEPNLPVAKTPSEETPTANGLSLTAKPESIGGENLPIATAPSEETPEIGELGPVAPPKPATAGGTLAVPTPGAVAQASKPEAPPVTPPAPEAGAGGSAVGTSPVPPAEPQPPAIASTQVPEKPVEKPAPVSSARPVAAAGETWAQRNLPLVEVLKTNSYYLQIGAYTDPESAKSAIDRVAAGYPLVVMPIKEHGRILYRVFVGPLNDDEKGAVLYWFRAKGYNDAFVRRGGES